MEDDTSTNHSSLFVTRAEESNEKRAVLMKAIVLEQAGPPEVLEIRQVQVPRPEPHPGWVLIQVKAFGLNRSELFTRQGYSSVSPFLASWALNVLGWSKPPQAPVCRLDKPWPP